jgi:hypothetical protein
MYQAFLKPVPLEAQDKAKGLAFIPANSFALIYPKRGRQATPTAQPAFTYPA